MSQFEDTVPSATFDSHEKPFHLPGSIQPHGVLLAVSTELEILQVSNNTEEYLSIQPQDLLGKPLEILLDVSQIVAIRQNLATKESNINPFHLVIPTLEGEKYFYTMAHQIEEEIILELEETDSQPELSFLSFHALTGGVITKMQRTLDMTEFLHLVADEYRKITDFDRVMVYQFDHQGAGTVIAEAKQENLSPYLGLHYPATDIPEPVRELYSRCLLRFIPNIKAEAVSLIPLENYSNQQPLNLSLSVLRSVDSCCVEFHQNMGVAALFVISIIKDQKLWGLISCHNYTPKHISAEVRKICEFLGQIVSSELAHKVDRSELDYQVKLKSLQTEFIESISQADNFIDALIKPQIRLLDLVTASGAAVCLDNEITLVGNTPNIEQVRTLIEWADTQSRENLFSTDSLPKLYPEAEAFKNTASGLLLLRISQVKRYYILWFRSEVIQTVNWAGDPNSSVKVESDGSLTLCPRNSFELWQETVRLTSLPWKECELDSALKLRNAIVGIVLNKADELAKINRELERSNRELASFAFAASHDLKEPLRGIHNYSTILLEDYAQVLDNEGVECLETVVSLSQRMEALINVLLRLSQLGQTELHLQTINLNQLLEQVIDVFRASRQDEKLDIRIPRLLPAVECDPVLLNEVFSNLIINAFKYNDNTEKWVEIGFLDADEQMERGLLSDVEQVDVSPMFYIKDNGIGIQQHHQEIIFRLFKRLHSQEKYGGGAGAGLAITKKIVERHNGRIWVESNHGKGATFYFTLK
jgi:light-regulated signal transduction histidine kinase (bacteriophytochrome)